MHYPSLNDSKNIGLAVYNVFMFSCLALVVEFVVTYPPLKMLVGRSIVLVGTTSTISLLFVPKVRKCRSLCKCIFQSNKTIICSSAFLVSSDIKPSKNLTIYKGLVPHRVFRFVNSACLN